MRYPAGQTLIEVLLSITIIVVGMVSLVTALINTQATATASIEEAVAVQLGRETIEAARFIRDSNWLERENGLGTAYDEGLDENVAASPGTEDYTGVYLWNPPQTNLDSAVSFNFTADDSSATQTTVYQNTGGIYRQFSGASGSSFSPSLYSRYVTLYPICSSDGGVTEQLITADGTACATAFPGTTEIGRQIQVTVTWSSRGTSHSRVLEERIYDWRYAQ